MVQFFDYMFSLLVITAIFIYPLFIYIGVFVIFGILRFILKRFSERYRKLEGRHPLIWTLPLFGAQCAAAGIGIGYAAVLVIGFFDKTR